MVVIKSNLTSKLIGQSIKIKVVEATDTASSMGQMMKTRKTIHRQSRYIELLLDKGVVDIKKWSQKSKQRCTANRVQVILELLDTKGVGTVVDTNHKVAYTHVQFDSSQFRNEYQESQFDYIELEAKYINRSTVVSKDPVSDSVVELFDSRAG